MTRKSRQSIYGAALKPRLGEPISPAIARQRQQEGLWSRYAKDSSAAGFR
jgi:hypothetical protein